jgi:hypothetical protein
MLFSEQELPVEIADLDHIWVGDDDVPFLARSYAKHRVVLQQLTSNCSCSNHEELALLNSLVELLATEKNCHMLLPRVWIFNFFQPFDLLYIYLVDGEACFALRSFYALHQLRAAEACELLYWHELLSDCLDNLL